MLRFQSLSYFYLVLPILILLIFYFFRYLVSDLKLKKNYSIRHLKFYFGETSVFSYGFLRLLFFISGCLCLFIALLRPQYGAQKVEMNAEGVEAVFVVDVSRSMAAEDIKPQRLKFAKVQLKKLTQILDGNKMGLIGFAGQVGVISPLTQDVGALNLFIDSLDFDNFSEQGTNINFALKEAKDLLLGISKEKQIKKSKNTQVVVLVTDGEDHSKDTLATAADLNSNGIRTFVIAVGSSAGGKIPIKDQFGQSVGYVRDRSRKIVESKPDFEFLKKLAKKGGGGFYKLDFGSKANLALAKDFKKLRKAKFKSQSFEVKAEYFQIPLFLGFVLLSISLVLRVATRPQLIKSLLEIEEMES